MSGLLPGGRAAVMSCSNKWTRQEVHQGYGERSKGRTCFDTLFWGPWRGLLFVCLCIYVVCSLLGRMGGWGSTAKHLNCSIGVDTTVRVDKSGKYRRRLPCLFFFLFFFGGGVFPKTLCVRTGLRKQLPGNKWREQMGPCFGMPMKLHAA